MKRRKTLRSHWNGIRQLLKIALQVIYGILTSSMLLTLERANASIALYSLNRNVLEKISTFFWPIIAGYATPKEIEKFQEKT